MRMTSRAPRLSSLAVAALVTAGMFSACSSHRAVQVHDIKPGDDLFGTLAKLKAGDEVVIHAGTYTTPGFYAVRWAGTAAAPITIRGAPGEARPVIVGSTRAQNIVNVAGAHFTLSHVEFRGGSHGLRLANVDHATFAGLVLHDLDDVGISCNRPGDTCDAVTIRDSRIYDTGRTGTGEGLYLGCQHADCVFKNGVVERNVVHDTGGSQGDGIEIKPGSFGNTVRGNAVYRTRFPGLTMWGFGGPAGRPNVVEGNVVWKAAHGGVWIMGHVVFRDNVVLASS